jgi:hypothetical protein
MGSSNATEVKLKSAGESITIMCDRCAPLSIGKWPEVEFAGNDGTKAVVIRVPKKSADRQLDRQALTYADCVGNTVTISRDFNAEMPDKPYWGVTVSKGGVKPPTRPAVPSNEPPPPDDEDAPENPAAKALAAKFALYDACMAHALKVHDRIIERYDGKGPTLDVAAMCATLYIQASR